MIEVGKSSLPTWLTYDTLSSTLLGVPSVKDRGTYILSVDNDLFAITVRSADLRDVAEPTHSSEEPVVCKPQDSLTQVKVTVNADTITLRPHERYNLIRDLSEYLSLKSQHVSLRSQTVEDVADPASALVSGVGDQKKQTSHSAETSSVLYWNIGCGIVKSHQMDILEKLETSAKDGSLGRKLGHGVIGWQVVISKGKESLGKRRLKRQVGVTATPSPGGFTKIYSYKL